MRAILYKFRMIKAEFRRQIFLSFIPHPSSFGFTLLEIMIALAVIGITVTAVLTSVNYHTDRMYENTLITQMFQLAKEKINELEVNQKNTKGFIGTTGFIYENSVLESEGLDIVELKTIVRGHGKEVVLRELVIKRDVK